MDKYKTIIKKNLLVKLITCGTPPAREWTIPPVMRLNHDILLALMTQEGYNVFDKMTDDEKKEAFAYLETIGGEICELAQCESFEEWSKDPVEDRLPIWVDDHVVEQLNQEYNLGIDLNTLGKEESNNVKDENGESFNFEELWTKSCSVEEIDEEEN